MRRFILLLAFVINGMVHLVAQVIPQCDNYSCWAGSLAMVSQRIDDFPKTINHFITISNRSNPQQNTFWEPCSCSTTTMPLGQVQTLARENLHGYVNVKRTSLGLEHMKCLFSMNKPIIYNYAIDGNGSYSHIVIMDTLKELILNEKPKIAFIRVKDPWPKCTGNEYYITYERYYIQPITNDTTTPHKYTISYCQNSKKCCNKSAIGVTDADNAYLKQVVFSPTAKGVVEALVQHIFGADDDFLNTVNLQRQRGEISIGQSYNVTHVNEATVLQSQQGQYRTIETLLNNYYSEAIFCLNQDSIIKTVVSTSKKINTQSPYAFYNNYIIYHIEKGTRYQNLNQAIAKSGLKYNLNVTPTGGLLINFLETYFLVLEKGGQYYVYDLYGDGFEKIFESLQIKLPVDNLGNLKESICSYEDFQLALNKYFSTLKK